MQVQCFILAVIALFAIAANAQCNGASTCRPYTPDETVPEASVGTVVTYNCATRTTTIINELYYDGRNAIVSRPTRQLYREIELILIFY